ncbi:MAG: septum formation initiator family protein [Candidatus Omnitrophica bacterium]|nr:septum formation initiator family protein [Candidatus Omnitrophota bacterium]
MLARLRKAFWLFGLSIFLLILFLPGYTKLQELRQRNLDLETQIKRLSIENTLLQKELERLENNPFYQEKILREKMGVVRKGEIPIKIVPKEKDKLEKEDHIGFSSKEQASEDTKTSKR